MRERQFCPSGNTQGRFSCVNAKEGRALINKDITDKAIVGTYTGRPEIALGTGRPVGETAHTPISTLISPNEH